MRKIGEQKQGARRGPGPTCHCSECAGSVWKHLQRSHGDRQVATPLFPGASWSWRSHALNLVPTLICFYLRLRQTHTEQSKVPCLTLASEDITIPSQSFPAGDPAVILGTQSMSLNSPLVLNKASSPVKECYTSFSLSPRHPTYTLKRSQDAIYTSVSKIKERFCKAHCVALGCLLPMGLGWCC